MEIRIKITDKTGHSEAVCQSASDARALIQQHESNGKWCYVDGKYTTAGTLTDGDIARASDIKLVNALVGGA